MRQKIIVANWKMYKTLSEAEEFMGSLPREIAGVDDVKAVVCAPFLFLERLAVLTAKTAISLGAQNMHWEKEGAFTGEISPVMLKDLGIKYVIIGHSERRQFFGESNFQINKKLAAAFAYGLIPILCVGENRRQRDAGETEEVIEKQLNSALDGLAVEKDLLQKMVLAYEPVWAIGSGTPANGEEANVVAAFMRSLLLKKGQEVSRKVSILYGGSVNPENIAEFTDKAEIDGALVGGSSLNVKTFAALIRIASSERRT
ncbi:MAG: triose-phosphate isomerase [Firmicutes bacterium]|nr:triose-phosphate isomerase [Bacillota bacterium]